MATERDLIELLASIRPTLTDKKAFVFQKMYRHWQDIADGTEIKENERLQYDGILWKCIKTHSKQADWFPSISTASMWTAINETHAGTIDDPIPVPEQLTSFEYEWGKYYKEGETLYLCNRQGGKDGDTYTLAYKPSQLVGQYFTEV